MLFNKENYHTIEEACLSKKEIIFEAPRLITAFRNDKAPSEWAAYPPAFLPPEGYARIFIEAGNDARGALMTLELAIHLDGGRILYKTSGEDNIALKVTWPKNA